MHLSRLLVAVASVAGIAATFAPWKRETLLSETVVSAGTKASVILSSMQLGDGWLTLVLFALILIVAFTGDSRTYLKGAKAGIILLLSIVTAGVCAYDAVKLNHSPIHPELNELANVSTPGYGLYIGMAASILIFFATLFSRRFRPVGKFE